jgi:hypothetical protein
MTKNLVKYFVELTQCITCKFDALNPVIRKKIISILTSEELENITVISCGYVGPSFYFFHKAKQTWVIPNRLKYE